MASHVIQQWYKDIYGMVQTVKIPTYKVTWLLGSTRTDIHIDIAMNHLRGLITYLKNYYINKKKYILMKILVMRSHMQSKNIFILELKVLREVLREEINTQMEVLNYIKIVESFPNVRIGYRILLTIFVTVASTKRSFSKLKLLKSYLRRTLQDRLNIKHFISCLIN
ncbi:hypothetical protein CR513_48007, partial [Mucuna pruriens]